MLENLIITIRESTGKLGTMKCGESGWSNDFISLLLLVRSISICLIWPGEKKKKKSNCNQFIINNPGREYATGNLILS